ncbi:MULTISPECIES: MFS transporter [unclassified Aureimonas]|uniref:MFS transporter n=1 Tax=unclassified Aureimonas TaxID=2615206 RepID=UPI0006FAD27A|nr:MULTISPECIES: MFS transporter [unclassified Aureimonas]KQT52481.1 MFS transporter [Aureimonas sp. Leaf427]KQT77618.1 MFS transporter [Aureimonas sp. Leaf460]
MTDTNAGTVTLTGSPPAEAGRRPSPKRLAAASMVGTALEWFEFTLYNTMAALIFNQIFFPQFDPIAGTILAFSTYAVGYLSRPLGGFLFGRLGDRVGRREVLMWTLVLMGGCTFAIGLLPTYATIGVWGSLLLVLLRFVQGVALGGEWAGAVLLTAEQASVRHRGFQSSWAQVGAMLGIVTGMATLAFFTTWVSDASFVEWGWRVPFLASVLVVAFGVWLRKGVPESKEFEKLEKEGGKAEAPITEIFTRHLRDLLVASGSRIGSDVLFGFLVVFSLTYLTQTLGVPRPTALGGVMLGVLANGFGCLAFSALSDRIGRRIVYIGGALLSAGWISVVFVLFDSRDPVLITVALVVALVLHSAMYGPQASFVAEQFTARVRYSGSSLAYTLAGAVGGGIAPLVFATLHREYAGTLPLKIYVWATLAVTIVSVFAAKETNNRPLKT